VALQRASFDVLIVIYQDAAYQNLSFIDHVQHFEIGDLGFFLEIQ